ncbi:hypothetical protein J6590_054539 [Homalodisca vitripennis]|nr:hypothetical protein J6590_054539 [Homalodisca vitripennis]
MEAIRRPTQRSYVMCQGLSLLESLGGVTAKDLTLLLNLHYLGSERTNNYTINPAVSPTSLHHPKNEETKESGARQWR